MTIFVLWILFAVVVGFIAMSMNRSVGAWFFVSLILSPLLGMVCLMFMGKAENPEEATTKAKAASSEQMEFDIVKSEFFDLYLSNPEHEKKGHIKELYERVALTPNVNQTDALRTAIQFMK